MREPLDPRVVDKIRQMEVAGARSTAEVRRHLITFVKTELFRGEDPPLEFSRRYYPTDADIRNILYTSRIGDRKAPDDQTNLGIKCTLWQEENPDDFIFYRVNHQQSCPETERNYIFGKLYDYKIGKNHAIFFL